MFLIRWFLLFRFWLCFLWLRFILVRFCFCLSLSIFFGSWSFFIINLLILFWIILIFSYLFDIFRFFLIRLIHRFIRLAVMNTRIRVSFFMIIINFVSRIKNVWLSVSSSIFGWFVINTISFDFNSDDRFRQFVGVIVILISFEMSDLPIEEVERSQ